MRAIRAMVAGGVDAIEIGFPYSDPVMDGPVIQAAAEVALKNGIGAQDVLDILQETTALDVPALVMTYWNPIEKFGVEKFVAAIATAGGSGVITPDLTIEESELWISETEKHHVNRVYVVAPSTFGQRLTKVTSASSGFIYAASIMGVTGTRTVLSAGARDLVSRVREVSTTPVCVGLGVSTREQAHDVAQFADGVIVGSAFIKLLQEASSEEAGLAKIKALAISLSLGVRR